MEVTMVVALLLLCTISMISAFDVGMIGPGGWKVMKVVKCPDDDIYPLKYEVSRRKVNRTHDGFNLHVSLDNALDLSYGILIEACKYVDGGCKPYQILADDCACSFIEKYGGDNMKKVLMSVEVDPPECPVPVGTYDVIDYVFNYEELPEKGIYGKYDATVFLLSPKNDEGLAQKLACMLITLTFDNNNDDD